LVEKTLNTSLGNKPFSIKREVYGRSQCLLTNSICDESKIGIDTAFDRAITLLKAYPVWNKKALYDRQALLTKIAHVVWNMPEPVSNIL
jgi:hypothetical protein